MNNIITESSYHTNRIMSKETYKLRRQVMNLIYEAKGLFPEMNRVEIRITDCDKKKVLGSARMGRKVIWIPARTIDCNGYEVLRHVVYHELCHALWGVEHDENCGLMHPIVNKPLSKYECQKIFLKYAQKYRT